MKWRYRLTEIKRNQKKLLEFIEKYSFYEAKEHDSPKLLSMDQKLGIAGELQRLQMIRKKIEKMNHLDLQEISDHYYINISSSINSGHNPISIGLENRDTNGVKVKTPLPEIQKTWGRTQ